MIELRENREREPNRVVIPADEMVFETARAGGPGGQNVNKVETKVRLLFDPWSSKVLSFQQKGALARNKDVQGSVNAEGVIVIVSQEHRTQGANKERAVEKLHDLIEAALKPVPERVATEVPEGAHEKRLEGKRERSRRKASRRERFDAD